MGGLTLAQHRAIDTDSTKTIVCRPVSEIRTRVEKTFHSIGALLDQLAAVAAAFQGYLRQDLDEGLELPRYSREFQSGLELFQQDFARLRDAEHKVAETAASIRGHGPGIIDHSIHLRSCTFTLKVISARFPEISGFAQEIADCVNRIRASGQRLTDEINRVSGPQARAVSAATDPMEQPVLEEIFRTEPASMRIAAQEIDQMIARLMSTLQSGDIASQRLDHIVQAVGMIEDAGLSAEERARFLAMIDDQLAQTIAELITNCGMFTENIELIASRISVLEENADRHRSGLADNYRALLKRIELYFTTLRTYVNAGAEQSGQQMHARGDEGPTAIETEISTIASAVRDIYYMALNTTLSCGRLGEGAASAAPVTAEIRYHVVHLGEIADEMATLAPVIRESLDCYRDIGNEKLAQLMQAEHSRLSRQVEAMAEHARQAWLSPQRLHELSVELLAEIPRLHQVTEGATPVQDHLAAYRQAGNKGSETARAEQLSLDIFHLYTMNLEREVHKRHFLVDIDSSDCDAINLFGTEGEGGQLDLAAVLF